jgi:hypothetical protein
LIERAPRRNEAAQLSRAVVSNTPMLSHPWKLSLFFPMLVAGILLTFLGLAAASSTPRDRHQSPSGRHHRSARRRSALVRRGRCLRPIIRSQPANTTVTAPARAWFRAAASTSRECSALTVRWQASTKRHRWFSVRGARSRTLKISPTKVSMSGRRYRAVFTNRAGSTTSRAARLRVHHASGPTPGSPATPPVNPPAPGSQPQLFASSSVWNQALPSDAPVDPSSPARIASLLGVINPPGRGVWINWNQYSVPVYRVPADQPTLPVTLDTPNPALQRAWKAVPIPPSAAPAPGVDASLVVYQPSTDRMWEFWQLSKQSDGFHARWGGAMASISTNPGYYSPLAWPNLSSSEGWGWGSSASSLPAVAGLMTISELRSGHIDHALAVSVAQACTWFVWPAQRTDGASTDPNCLPEGAHLRLDPSLDLPSLNLPPIAQMMATAMQRYGIIVHDTSNSSVSFFAEQPADGSDPYDGPNGIFGGLQEWQFLPQIPWGHLRLLQMGPGCRQAPCPASGS